MPPHRTDETTPPGPRPSRTIGQLAEEFGVSLRTLRFYEDKGMLRPRREGVRRLYAPADRERLRAILRARGLGFTLREIGAMLSEPASEAGSAPAAVALDLTPAKVEEQIAHLRAQRTEIDAALRALEAYRGDAARIPGATAEAHRPAA